MASIICLLPKLLLNIYLTLVTYLHLQARILRAFLALLVIIEQVLV